jgi:uncharacterized membrane protein
MPDIGGFTDAILGVTIIGILASLLVPVLVIGVVIWAIRRNAPRRDPAEQALRDRLARGEISDAEFYVRMRALNEADEA